MIFNEIYGRYYNAVARMIRLAVDGVLTEEKMNRIAAESAFSESRLAIVPALKNQNWQLIDHEYGTPLKNQSKMPLTILEKRWLKTILLDQRIALFQIPAGELRDVEPLFEPADIVYFDRYLDGDRYDHPSYIANFYIIQQAIRERKKVKIKFWNGRNQERTNVFSPIKIEYSDKEDKFRILCAGKWDVRTINMGRVIQCVMLEERFPEELRLQARNRDTVVLELTDERNALERVMMKFAHHRKVVERIEDNRYRVELEYDIDDETDVLIQIMSFGRFLRILAPARMKEEYRDRIARQLNMLDW